MSRERGLSSGREHGLKWRALFMGTGAAIIFFNVYSVLNLITSHRGDVGMAYFEWERFIPLIPLMIIPYMTIDILFLSAPFLCRSRRELSVFAKRILMASAVGAACFLLFPLEYAFPRPEVAGLLGAMFRLLHHFDRPFNMLPSLHVTLSIILCATYRRHTKSLLRILAVFWFGLIIISTLFTHQHHILDLAFGLLLGSSCLLFVREQPLALRFGLAPRIARRSLRFPRGRRATSTEKPAPSAEYI
jgi:membrane-associated phospholipid phosphatase